MPPGGALTVLDAWMVWAWVRRVTWLELFRTGCAYGAKLTENGKPLAAV